MRADPRNLPFLFTENTRPPGAFCSRGGAASPTSSFASSWIVVVTLLSFGRLRSSPESSALLPRLLRWNSSSAWTSSAAAALSTTSYALFSFRPWFGIDILVVGADAAAFAPLLPPQSRLPSAARQRFFCCSSSSSRESHPDMPSTAMAPTTTTTTTTAETTNTPNNLRFVDIGANLLDDRFVHGVYRGTFRHEPDVSQIIERAVSVGVKRIVLTAGTLEESRMAVQTVREWRAQYPQIQWSCTIGVHPTRCQQEFVDSTDTDHTVLEQLLSIAQDGMHDHAVSAIGEIGLDYDRLEFCSKDVQHTYLRQQLRCLAKPTGLPLFLHNRSAQSDLHDILVEESDCWQKSGGVVHSFDDTHELASQFVALGLYIGLNGCSLKTVDNLNVVRSLPLDKIVLETDAPYCEIRSTHAGYSHVQTHFPSKPEKKFERGMCVKGRQESCHIVQVAQVVAGTKDLPLEVVADACYRNTCRLFGWPEEEVE